MLGLGAYGSSDESDTESAPPPAKKPTSTLPKPNIPQDNDESELKLNLPKASSYSIASTIGGKESTSIIQKREWEVKLAEEEKKKLPKAKKKIAAFGGLSSTVFEKEVENDDVIQKPLNRPIFASESKSAFLSSLPPPKSFAPAKSQTSTLSFLPSTIKMKPVSKLVAPSRKPASMKPDSDNEEDTNFNDFLGLDTVQKKELPNFAAMPTVNMPNMFLIDEPIGPARPPPQIVEEVSSQSSTTIKQINDEAAKKLIYKHEVETWGASNVFASDAVSGMIDVNVDNQIGPNIHQTLLKNIDHRSMASFAAGKEQRQVGGKKGPTEKLAKMKHQITHLANMAVARDDELKEQWAASRESKAASKRKYGF